MFTEKYVIMTCSTIIQNFYNRQINYVYNKADPSFVWIGANDFQWAIGLDEFIKITKDESQEAPVTLTNEEYHLLRHVDSIWIVYGRYQVTAVFDDGRMFPAKVRITFVLEEQDNDLKMLHVHGSNAQDYPIAIEPYQPGDGYFNYLKRLNLPFEQVEKIAFKDRNHHYHYIHLNEIKYIEAQNHYVHVYTLNDDFEVRTTLTKVQPILRNDFKRIHRGFIVNRNYIERIRHNAVFLISKEELPVSRSNFLEVDAWLKKTNHTFE